MTAEVILTLDALSRIGQLRAHCLRSALKRERHGERLPRQNLIGTPDTNFSNMVTYRSATPTLPQQAGYGGSTTESGCQGRAERAPNVGRTRMAATWSSSFPYVPVRATPRGVAISCQPSPPPPLSEGEGRAEAGHAQHRFRARRGLLRALSRPRNAMDRGGAARFCPGGGRSIPLSR